jgi:hypothetical protein
MSVLPNLLASLLSRSAITQVLGYLAQDLGPLRQSLVSSLHSFAFARRLLASSPILLSILVLVPINITTHSFILFLSGFVPVPFTFEI